MDPPLKILFEDNHLLVVNKPAGLGVQEDITGDKNLVGLGKKYIKKKYNKPGKVFLGLVHRIDRPVSGLVILTKTSKALSRMNAQFKDRSVEKIYWAITESAPPVLEDTLTHWLIKDRKINKVKAFKKQKPGSVKAVLEYKTIGRIDKFYLLEIKLSTGRFHQIRVQLSSINCPILGDVKYGYKIPLQDKSIALHAKKIRFMHPVTKKEMKITADLPLTDYWEKFINT